MPIPYPAQTPFVGRVAELARLRSLLAMAGQQHGASALITGEAGVGKTRLLSELTNQAQALGWLALTSAANQITADVPYTTLAEIIGPALGYLPASTLEAALGDGLSDLAVILPALATGAGDRPGPPALSPDLQRYRLFELVAHLLRMVATATRTGLLICLDDLQWADPSTITALAHVIRRLKTSPVVVLASARLAEVEVAHPLRQIVAALLREQRLQLIELSPLAPADVATLLSRRTGLPIAPLVAATIGTITAGNPFFAEAMIDHLIAQGHPITQPVGQLDDWTLPTNVRLLVEARLHRLSTAAQRVTLAVAVLGEPAPIAMLAAVLNVDEAAVLDGLDEAVRAGLLAETATGHRCQHALLQAGLLALVSPPRQQALYRQAVIVIEQLWSAEASRPVALLAEYAARAGPDQTMHAKAQQYALQAAERARARLAYDDAIRFLQRALALEESQPAPTLVHRCTILLALGEVQRWAGQIPAARATYRQAVAVARQADHPVLLARAVLGLRIPREEEAGQSDVEQLALLEEALNRLGPAPTALRARLLATQIRASWAVAAPAEALARDREAISIARQANDDQALMMALSGAPGPLWQPAGRAQRLARGAEIVRIAHGCQDSWYEQLGALWQMGAALEAADRPALDSAAVVISQLANAAPHPGYTFAASAATALQTLLDGRLTVAERLIECVEQAGQQFDWPRTTATTMLYSLLQIRREQGRLAEMVAPLTAAAAAKPAALAPRIALAYCYAESDQPSAARRLVEDFLAPGLATYQHNANWLACLVMVADSGVTLGERAWLELLEPWLVPHAECVATLYNIAACLGAVARPLGRLYALTQRWEAAAHYFELALAIHQRLGAPLWLAHTADEYAQMLLASGEPAARPRAIGLLRQAQTLFSTHQSCWATPLATLLTSLSPASPAGPTRRPRGADQLSEREREVLQLVADGYSDQAVAQRLSISPNTVGRHLSRIYAKIGVTNRAGAVAYLVRHQSRT